MDEKRISRMVHLAMFEQIDGKDDIEISRFFRLDYIVLGLLKNIVLVTIAFIIVLGFAAVYNFEFLAVNFTSVNWQPIILGLVVCYLLMVGVFSVIVFVIRGLRYEKAARRMNQYSAKLIELDDIYEYEKKLRKNKKRKGGE